jgi:hypothetical protein
MNPHWPIPARQTRIESGERHICVDEFFDLARVIEFDPFRALADTPLIPRLAVRDLPPARCPIMYIFDLTRILRRGCRHQAGHGESVFVSVGIIQCAARSCTPQANSTSRIRCCAEALRLVTGHKHVHSLP